MARMASHDVTISDLVTRFERGALTRRELIQGLSMLTAAAGAESAAWAQGAASGPAAKGVKVDHVSIQVSDLPRSIAFYESLFGFAVVSEDKPNEIVRLGAGKVVVSLHHKNPTGIVDHFAIGVENFNKDAVTRELKARGFDPQENLDAGFHVKDPQGIGVQIVAA